MTQDEINEMVKQVGFHGTLSIGVVMDAKQLKAFAKLAAAKEREAHRSYIHELERELEVTQDKLNECLVADYMKKSRGQA